MKFVPLTVSVAAAPLGAAEFGLIEVMVGGLTVNTAGVETTLPFFTTMANVPAALSNCGFADVQGKRGRCGSAAARILHRQADCAAGSKIAVGYRNGYGRRGARACS